MNSIKQQNGITQHLSATTLSEYASGTLSEALEVLVACHLTLCPHCREQARIADQMGGYFIEDAESVKPRLSAIDVLQSLESNAANDSTFADSLEQSQANEKQSGTGFETAAHHGIPNHLPEDCLQILMS